jgi:Flp pilus assembly protein TadG
VTPAVEGSRDSTDDQVTRRGRSDRGEALVTVLMVPFILIGMMLVVQFGLAYSARQVMAGAAQDGAASGAREGASAATGQVVADELAQSGASHLLTSYSSSSSSDGNVITVTTQGKVLKVFPLFPSITVSATGSASIERFVPQGAP